MAFFETTYRIGVTDVGISNKLTNKGIIKIFENAGAMHSDKLGYGLNQIKDTKLSWILLNWKIQVIDRPIYNSIVKIITWASEINQVTTCRDFEMYDDKNNLVAIATTKWALVNIDTKKIELITDEINKKYSQEDKFVFEGFVFKKTKEPEKIDSSITCNISKRDIDINGHVHNLYYLDFAYEALPEMNNDEEFNNIEIMYKKEMKLEDNPIKCNYTKDNEKNIVTIKSNDNKVLHSIVTLY